VPVRFPFGAGATLIEMLQDAPAFSSVPQVFVCTKNPADDPVTEMPLIVKVAVP
jgi:hypothetical protein